MENLFPLFLKLTGRRVVLVGAGSVARVKLEGLLAAGAQVTVVAPQVGDGFSGPGVVVKRRPFAATDLEGAWLAVAAATPQVNQQVAAEAERRRIFVNAVDDPKSASVYTGGVIRRGGVTLALSTEGRAPALAGLLREALEALLPDDLAEWLWVAKSARTQWKARGVPMRERRPLLLEALNRLYADRDAEVLS